MTRTRILDACCGSRMFWYDRDNKYTVYLVFFMAVAFMLGAAAGVATAK